MAEPYKGSGGISRYHTVECRSCLESNTSAERTIKRATEDFKLWGWRKIAGKWTCPDCVKKKGT